MILPIFAADPFPTQIWWLVPLFVAVAVFLVFLFVCFNFVQLWIQAYLAGARIGFMDMIRMKLLKVDYVAHRAGRTSRW